MPDEPSKHHWLRKSHTLNPQPGRVAAKRFREGGFYDPEDLLQVRYEAVRQALQGGTSRAAAALAHGFSRSTLHRLLRLFRERGLAGLVPRKRGPRGPTKITPEILRFVDEQRSLRGHLGSTVLVREIQSRFGVSIHRVSLDQALARRAKKKNGPGDAR